ncbi:hypothetical protein ACSV3Y_004123 [Escherichia coli]|uniref:hypothetical protein n=1 Tax=Escherichia coli TaxID=562 RepID=UPI000A9937BE|nr:hypothetical protein [Escherichia coli]
MPGTAPHPAGFGCVSFFRQRFPVPDVFQAHHPGEVFFQQDDRIPAGVSHLL